MNFHVSFDRTQIVNCGPWKSREARAGARETAKIAGSSTPVPYELRQSVAAADE